MKKFCISLLSAAFLVVFVVGCNRQNEVQVAPNPVQEKEPTSVIDLMEKEEGVKYFKKDVLLKDPEDGSQVLMRFACKDESKLQEHLLNNQFSINAISPNMIPKSANVITNQAKQNDIPPVTQEKIVLEPIAINLTKGSVGYKIHVISNKSRLKNARSQNYTELYELVSMNWPEEIHLEVYPRWGGGQTCVQMGTELKWRWYSDWQPLSPWTIYCSDYNTKVKYGPSSVDGPWRVKARVYYPDPYYQNFEVWFVDL